MKILLPRIPLRLLLCLALFGSARAVQADVAFTTLKPDSTYDGGAGQFVSGSNNGFQSIANAFTPSFTGNLIRIDLGISIADPDANGSISLRLNPNDPSTNRPNTSIDLASGGLVTMTIYGTSDSALVTFNYSGPALSLVSGQTYWLVLAPANPNTNVVWHFGGAGVKGSISNSINGTTYNAPFTGDLSAFRVNAVPEPSTYALSAAGAGLLYVFVRRRRLH